MIKRPVMGQLPAPGAVSVGADYRLERGSETPRPPDLRLVIRLPGPSGDSAGIGRPLILGRGPGAGATG
ncbi:hypothetical protein NDU88_007393 [Pleurodeles waltl]|uniref:Uncharacterized protein n=1 Tax=Pleurodeles waltl TaxID=8319 RepID=A0AAV7MFM9_PLEWA|nr:hypothetical protein NDU88_007393 [Pleurodeles waltl]